IVHASDSFFNRMLLRPSDILGKGLLDVVRFDQAERLLEALSNPHGQLPFVVYRVDGELRIANVYFYRTQHREDRYIYLGWQELTDLYYLQSAFDAVEDPLVVIGADAHVHYANR